MKKEKAILITGGAGYIGSHTAYLMYEQGHKLIIIDSFLHNQEVHFPRDITVIRGDFADKNILSHIFTHFQIDAVIHFAAFIEVGESVKRPADFYDNNVTKVLSLLDMMRLYRVNRFIFSSSCAVYGLPHFLPMTEEHPTNPESPYGKNKLMIEYVLHDYAQAYGLQAIALRYFNAAGSLISAGLGEQHAHETHLIPLLLRALEHDREFLLFGDDYPTRDGSCERDFIHVIDLAYAHLKAYEYMAQNQPSSFLALNVGSGKGHTVKEVISVAERLYQKPARTRVKPRRPGDVPILVAQAAKAQLLLNWQPSVSDIETIVQSAYAWECSKLKACTSVAALQPRITR